MKLNIGCGYNRLKGYINIDSNADTPADKIMPAHNLDFAGASVEEIKALQLIEHLGFFKTKYFLSECRRVLEPGGRLIIETPDIAKTFELFLKGGEAQKESALGWVYGGETKGMNHLYCFPAELLAKLLKEAGFEIIESAGFYFQTDRPALRFKVIKKDSKNADLASALRKRLLSENIPCFEDEIIVSEQEKVIKSLLSAQSPDAALRQAVYSAEIVFEYFGLELSGGAGDFVRKAVCGRLLEDNLQGRLTAELEKKAVNGVFSDKDFNSVFAAGLDYLDCFISGKSAVGPPPAQKIKIFSRAAAEDFRLKKWLLSPSK
jgi:SAM-dependent methyltransferase